MSISISSKRSQRSRQKEPARRGLTGAGWMVGCALLTWAGATALMLGLHASFYATLAPEQQAPVTVVAGVDFTCADLARTELSRRQAADAVHPVFTRHMAQMNANQRDLDKLFGRIAQLRQLGAVTNDAATRALVDMLDLLGLTLSGPEALELVPEKEPDAALGSLKQALKSIFEGGIVSEREKASRFQGVAKTGKLTLQGEEDQPTRPVELDALPTPDEAQERLLTHLLTTAYYSETDRAPLRTLLHAWMVPNLVFEPGVTEARRVEAAATVTPVPMTVSKGTTLIEGGERATPQAIEMLRAHDKRLRETLSPYDYLLKMIGSGGLMALGLFVALAWMGRVYPEGLRQRSLMILFMALSLLSLAAVRLFVHLAIFLSVLSPALLDFVIPLALAPLLASILVGGAYAFALGLWISLAAAVLTNQSLHVLFLGLLVTSVSVLASRRVRKRSKVFQAGLWIGLAKVLYVVFAAVLVQQSWRIVTSQLLAAVLSGVGVALVALLAIPLFEYLFGLTTDIHLLELSDPGHPLLQRLAVEAPGTYHHSLMLASLAQSAADRIGANSLLVRVCAYFHDIGKLTKPEYFTENTLHQRSPHDDLAPSMSTLVIMAHVKEGVSFALRHRLPRPIIEAIQQHHGTGVVEYFYHRARRQRDEAAGGPDDASLKEHFRYPGPRPRSREMAVLMLADSVEAASRSMEKATPAKLEALVDEIVSARLRDDQLDQSALTFAELTEIKRSFVFTLTNMLHGRIPYPKDENRNRSPTEKVQDEPGAAEGLRAGDARPGAGDEPGPSLDVRGDSARG